MTSNNVTVSVVGVRELMKAIRQIDPELRRTTVKEIKSAAKPIQQTAKDAYPSEIMRNWKPGLAGRGRTRGGAGWPGYSDQKARSSVKINYGGKARKNEQRWRLLRVVQSDAAASIFDMAGRKNPSGNGTPQAAQFMFNLSGAANGKSASRTIWPAVESHMSEVTASVLRALKVAEARVQQKVNA